MLSRRFAIGLVLVACLSCIGVSAPRRTAAVAPPTMTQSRFITFVAGALRIEGSNLGSGAASRSITFNYEGTSTTVDAASSAITAWTDTRIDLTLLPVVHSGTVTVTVDGIPSIPATLMVLERDAVSTAGVGGNPLAVAITGDGRVWVDDEFHTELKSVTPTSPLALERRGIPQPPGSGIFALTLHGDEVSRISELGEDVDVDSRGDVWFTQGGAYLYDGVNLNTSRVVRYRPSTQGFACYPIPDDSPELTGLLVDEARGLVWYTENALFRGNALGAFDPATALSDCDWDPRVSPRPLNCDAAPTNGCHQHYPMPSPHVAPAHLVLDGDGDIWITEFWANAVARFSPATATFVELPLPAPIVRQGPGLFVGSGPWEIAIDGAGMLWITEYFDATITRIDPSKMTSSDCTHLDAQGANPCASEVFVGSDGIDAAVIHSLEFASDGNVWFSPSSPTAGSRIGAVDPATGAVTLSPSFPDATLTAGIAMDPASGAVWLADYNNKRMLRFRPASGDGDGIAATLDNCPDIYNPGQENADRNFTSNHPVYVIDDRTNPRSDNVGDACDSDTDNDGVLNGAETDLAPLRAVCPSASAVLDPMKLDTDGDRVVDGAECALGSDPADPLSRPATVPAAQDSDGDTLSNAFELSIGTDPAKKDTDGDGLQDAWEVKGWGSDPLRVDTDGDGAVDACEVASVNPDMLVTPVDQAIIAAEILRAVPPAQKLAGFDQNKDGLINPGDQAFQSGVLRSARCRFITPWP